MDDDQRATLTVPAIAANCAHISRMVGAGGTRLTFGEIVDDVKTYRVAISMPDAVALALRDMLNAAFPPPDKQN